LDVEQRILLEHTSPAFDQTRIRNAQQMLACEGVLATIFYQVNTNEKLSGSYLPASFYTQFLIKPIPEGVSPDQLFSPVENMMLKHFAVWNAMNNRDITGSPLMVWLQEWCRLFPEDRQELVRLFIQLTHGATVSRELSELAAKINYVGQTGDYQSFRALLPKYQELVKQLTDRCIADPSQLEANIGPELWVTSRTVKIRRALWMPEPKNFLSVNLNSASLPELAVFMEAGQASRFMEMRRAKGFFTDFEQIRQSGFTLLEN
jgi:hypothetical protein